MSVSPDDERMIEPADEDVEILPDQTLDDTDEGWGEWSESAEDARLVQERPPHW